MFCKKGHKDIAKQSISEDQSAEETGKTGTTVQLCILLYQSGLLSIFYIFNGKTPNIKFCLYQTCMYVCMYVCKYVCMYVGR